MVYGGMGFSCTGSMSWIVSRGPLPAATSRSTMFLENGGLEVMLFVCVDDPVAVVVCNWGQEAGRLVDCFYLFACLFA